MHIPTASLKRQLTTAAAIAVMVGGMASSQAADALTEGLTFYAPMDGSAEATQSEGDKAPGKDEGTSFVEGKFGEGIEIKGDAKLYYRAEGNFKLNEGTVALWAKRNKSWKQDDAGYILIKAVAGPGWNKNSLYFMITEHNQIRVWVWNDEKKQTLYMTSPVPAQANEWYHLAFTYADGDVKIFVNGEEGSYTGDGKGDAMMVMPTGDVKFVQVGSDYDHSFDGVVDELRFYNRVLSPEEIKAVFEYQPKG